MLSLFPAEDGEELAHIVLLETPVLALQPLVQLLDKHANAAVLVTSRAIVTAAPDFVFRRPPPTLRTKLQRPAAPYPRFAPTLRLLQAYPCSHLAPR